MKRSLRLVPVLGMSLALLPVLGFAQSLSAEVRGSLKRVIGLKDDAAILKVMSGIAPAPDGGEWIDFDKTHRALSYSIGQGGGPTMKSTPLGKLPVGIFYVGRGSGGQGPAFLKFSFLQKPKPVDAFKLISDVVGVPGSKLKFGKLLADGKVKIRMVTGSKYVIYTVNWNADPKSGVQQIVIGTRQEPLGVVTVG